MPSNYLEREHELKLARAPHDWKSSAVAYVCVAAVVIVAILSGFAQWALSK